MPHVGDGHFDTILIDELLVLVENRMFTDHIDELTENNGVLIENVLLKDGQIFGDINGNILGDITGNILGDIAGDINSSGLSTFSGNVDFTGATVSGLANLHSNVVGNITGDLFGNLHGAIIGDTVATGNIYATLIGSVYGPVFGNLTGSLLGNTPVVGGNLIGNTVGTHFGNVIGNITGNSYGTHHGNVIGNVSGNLFGTFSGNILGNLNGTVIGNVFGNVFGNLFGHTFGNITGNIIGSTTIIGGNVNGNVNGTLFGNVIGNLFGTHFGNVLGNVTGFLIGDTPVTGNILGNTAGTHFGPVFGNVTGNLTGTHIGTSIGPLIGNVTGNLFGSLFGTLYGNLAGNLSGDIVGNVTGNLTGYVLGNLIGTVLGNVQGTVIGNLIGNLTAPTTYVTGNLVVNQLDVSGNILIINKDPISSTNAGYVIQRYQLENNSAIGDVVADPPDLTGTAQGSGVSSITLALSASAFDDTYNDWWIRITAGTGTGQVRKIINYTGVSRVATVSGWVILPDITSVYALYPCTYAGTIYDTVNTELSVVCLANVMNPFNQYIDFHAGNITGLNITGNIIGNVTGTLTGNVLGNVTGNLTGDVTGNLTGDIVSSGTSVFNGTTNFAIGAVITGTIHSFFGSADMLAAATTFSYGLTPVSNFYMPANGQLRLITAAAKTAIGAGSIMISPSINGVAVGTPITLDNITQAGTSTVTDAFVTGDLLGVEMVTDGPWTYTDTISVVVYYQF